MPHPILTKPLTTLRLQPVASIGLAFGSGVLMALATAPLNAFPLAWVALAPLWVITLTQRERESSLSKRAEVVWALAWGIGYHGLALSWIQGLHPLTWLGIPWIASVAIVLFAWLFITLWGATLVALWVTGMRFLIRSSQEARSRSSLLATGWGRVLLGTGLWCGLEWVWSLGSLYWTSLSYTQSPGNLWILHLGQLAGPTGITAAIVMVNGLIAEAWMRYPRAPQRASAFLLVAAVLLTSLHRLGYELYSRPLAQTTETALRVGIIQGNVATRSKHTAQGVRQAVEGYTQGYEALADQGVEAVLTPEGAFPYLWDDRDKEHHPFYQAVIRRGRVGWLGTFVPQDNRITQSLLSLTGQGAVMGRYNKIKLVPLGEFIPFQEVLGGLISRLSPVQFGMVPGTEQQQFDTPFGRAIASICYDSAFPEVFRRQAASGGQFILTASNLDPYSEVLMAQHQAQDLMRSIETDRWAVRATNTGYSGIIDPHGSILWRSQARTYAVHADTIYRRQTQTLYVRWGDWLTPLLLSLGAILWAISLIKLQREPSNPSPPTHRGN